MINVSYTILTHNEDKSLKELLQQLFTVVTEDDEIIIVDDFSDNPNTLEIFKWATSEKSIVSIHQRKLDGDFATQKNYANSLATKKYIFNIDADELLGKKLLSTHKDILEKNNEAELFSLARVNTIDGITENHFRMWGWKAAVLPEIVGEKLFDSFDMEYQLLKNNKFVIKEEQKDDKIYALYYKPIINWDDRQFRIYLNTKEIGWINKVHEYPTGHKSYAEFPSDSLYALHHNKSLEKQESQNTYYSRIKRD